MSAESTFQVTDDPAVLSAAKNLLVAESPQWLNFRPAWERLSDDQFMAAMRLAIAENAIKVAAVWAQVTDRLRSCELQTQLLTETAAQIKSVDRPALLLLEQSPLDIRLAILTGLDPLPAYQMRNEKWWDQHVPAVELLVDALYQLDATARSKLLGDVYPKFSLVHPVLMYRTVRQCIRRQAAKGIDRDDYPRLWLMLAADAWLTDAGYKRGHIVMGVHKGMDQPYVMEDGEQRMFVPDRRAHRYYPKVDDEVLFKPDRGIVLVNKPTFQVVAVCFIPAL